MSATVPAEHLHVAVLNGRQEAFYRPEHARALVEQWNRVVAPTIARDRAEGRSKAADRLSGHVEPRDPKHWQRYGPGGMAAVWTRVPEFRMQYVRRAGFVGITTRRKVTDSGLQVRQTWEFQSWFTTTPVQRRVEIRPSGSIEVSACGLDREAVESAFKDGVDHVTTYPNSDDTFDPVDVLRVLRALAEGDGRKYAPYESAFHADVRAAHSCGLVEEKREAHEAPSRPLVLTKEGLAFVDRHSLMELPDPQLIEWDDLPSLAWPLSELAIRAAGLH
ncbi:hypothetical protein [Streptomyces californicus]|uniref:hypothetical protein n=1 Tax=Streptomyces californicus TaxID=67351 RepID=UPI0029700819|nr:hypothetical protein [Streptomyces californicus]MDW4912633.1 hypothetical protein [Streptomyces californicus]